MTSKNPYKRDLWHKLNGEERCWVILRSVDSNVLSEEDVSDFLTKDRVNTFGTFVFPLSFLPLTYFGTRTLFPNYFTRQLSRGQANFYTAGIALSGFLLWKYTNPFKKNLTEERERLLGEIENRIGGNMMLLNEMLPRYFTEFEIIRRIRVMVNRRHSMFSGILFEEGEKKKPMVNPDIWPKSAYGKLSK